MKLETAHLLLRPWCEEDADELYELAKDPRVGPDAGWVPHKNVNESRAILRDEMIAAENYAIQLKSTDALIGSADLRSPADSNLHLHKGEAEFGVWLGRCYWDHGYAYEAGDALIHHGFYDLGLSRIYACSFTDNFRSDRLQEKLGFRFRKMESHHYCAGLDSFGSVNIRILVRPELEI